MGFVMCAAARRGAVTQAYLYLQQQLGLLITDNTTFKQLTCIN